MRISQGMLEGALQIRLKEREHKTKQIRLKEKEHETKQIRLNTIINKRKSNILNFFFFNLKLGDTLYCFFIFF